MGKRRRAREMALLFLYQQEFQRGDLEESLKAFWRERATSGEIKSFAEELVLGVKENQEIIDTQISRAAEHWSLSRIALVDRNIIRIATYELLFRDDTPQKVALNEAIELAKIYGTSDSSRFVNGVLDQIRASRNGALRKPHDSDPVV